MIRRRLTTNPNACQVDEEAECRKDLDALPETHGKVHAAHHAVLDVQEEADASEGANADDADADDAHVDVDVDVDADADAHSGVLDARQDECQVARHQVASHLDAHHA